MRNVQNSHIALCEKLRTRIKAHAKSEVFFSFHMRIITSETPDLSSYDDDSVESVCSFQSVSSLFQKMFFKKNNVKQEILKPDQIKASSSLYVKSADNHATYFSKSGFKASKKEKMIWVVKGSPKSVKYQKSSAQAA
ncbi:hypothetical protein L6452_18193 [Arctium lappa]|uniref:Uncharacterized protein n=1 Tax=Arctium lappa TaxID=4217 RepID=A0ACB9C5I3_ARCLA|nr:hypothetical protein L6452_18193 [Arctium lappa]